MLTDKRPSKLILKVLYFKNLVIISSLNLDFKSYFFQRKKNNLVKIQVLKKKVIQVLKKRTATTLDKWVTILLLSILINAFNVY